MMKSILRLVAVMLTFGALQATAVADVYPAKPVRIIVPSPPGSVSDVTTRFIADALSRKWGQQVLVENRPGGGSNIGLRVAAASTPDGYGRFFVRRDNDR
jgi:tripartite-type tricarboxylate transporter receptor subunit TctC